MSEQTVFDDIQNPEAPKEGESLFDYVNNSTEVSAPALPTTSLLLTAARMDTSKNPLLQMQDETLQQAKTLLESGQEATERSRLAAERAQRQAGNLNILRMDPLVTPEESAAIDEAYKNVLTWDAQTKQASAIEREAIDKIREVASRDPVQARVLLDNLEHGDAEQTHSDFLIKSAILAQRAEELDQEYNDSGWGRAVLNFVLNIAPTNYNFQRSGIVKDADTGLLDWLLSGEGLRKQSEALWSMDVDSFAEYAKRDGELMQAIRSNATTIFDMTADPAAAKELLASLTGQSDEDRMYTNVWGGIEAASVLPVGKIAGVTKTLARAGARKEAQQLLARAAQEITTKGEAEALKGTAITADELKAAQSTSHVDPALSSDTVVPHALDLAAREAAARQAIEDLGVVIREQRLTDPEEIATAYEKLEENFLSNLANPIKDVRFERFTDTVASGNEVRGVEFIFGKVDGTGGYARKATAENAAQRAGVEGEVFRAEDGQWYVRGKVYMPENGVYTNALHPQTQGFLSRLTGRWWRSSARTADSTLHGKAVGAGSAIAREQRLVSEAVRKSYLSIPEKSRDVVEQIALAGQNFIDDATGKSGRWWTDDEFNTLAQRAYGRDATEGELRVYRDLQLYNDMDWVLRNDQIFLDKVTRGMESAKFRARGQDFDLDVKINYSPTIKPTTRIFNASEGVHYTAQKNPLTDAYWSKLVDEGFVLVEPEEAIRLADGTLVDKILIRRTELEVSPLRRTQLAYSEGGHRMYTDQYFVKQANRGVQPDTGVEFLSNPRAFRTAENLADASKWADTMNAARLAVKDEGFSAQDLDDLIFKGDQSFPSGKEFLEAVNSKGISLDDPFEAVFDKELPSAYASRGPSAEDFVNPDEMGFNGYYRTTGRMYTGHKGEALRNVRGELSPTLDPYKALTTSLQQVTRQQGLFNYKVEAIDRFLKTYANDLDMPDNVRSPYEKFNLATKKAGTSLERWNEIEAQRFAIRNVLGFETPLEKSLNETWRHMAESALGTGDNLARKAAHDAIWWFKENNPVSSLRGIAFDAKLGLFNVGQWFIQSSTMFAATALSPNMGMKGMMTMPLHAYLLKNGSENTLDVLAKRGVWKWAGFSNEQEFKEYARYMHRSGFMDMNGAHLMIGQNGPTAYFGSFAEKVSRGREAARIFFYKAEVNNRLVAFRIAWDEAIQAGLKPGQEGFHAQLLKRADDYSMNMTHEAAAYWQKGALSIPTQFWSYSMRMMDAMLGSKFTPAQRARLALINTVMAGTAGIPVVEAISHYYQAKTGEVPEVDTLMGTLDRGLVDRMVYEMTGADVRVGEKLGTGSMVRDIAESILGTSQFGPKPFIEVAGGATFSITKNISTVLWDVMKYSFAESGSDMGNENLTGDAVLKLFQEISTFGNAHKAMLAAQYQIYKSNSGTIYDQIPAESAVYIALGFKPQDVTTMMHRQAYLRNRKETIDEAAGQIAKWRQEAFITSGDMQGTMAKVNMYVKMLPPDIRQEVLKKANNRDVNQTLFEYVDRKYEEEAGKQEIQEQLEEEGSNGETN